jgi:hypothetical protein
MTLVAAHRSYEVPTLLGDFLITSQGKPAGYYKKIHRFSDNLVIAWTGHLIVAGIIFRDIRVKLPKGNPTKKWLEESLSKYSPDFFNPQDVHLIGGLSP